MQYIGIDYGLRRIGMAQSNGILATPIGTIENRGPQKTIRDIAQYITQNTICILGLPLHADGTDSDFVPAARQFGNLLAGEFGCQIVYHNEYMSSALAEQHIRTTKTKETLDAVAATMILQEYLDERKNKEEK